MLYYMYEIYKRLSKLFVLKLKKPNILVQIIQVLVSKLSVQNYLRKGQPLQNFKARTFFLFKLTPPPV